MRIPLKFFLPFFIALIVLLTGVVLITGSTYFYYQTGKNQLIQDKVSFLKVLNDSTYDPQYSSIRDLLFEKLSESPGVAFFRDVEPGTGKIVWSGVKGEISGESISNIPDFKSEAGRRQGEFQGKSVEEIYIIGIANEGLWMGIDLGQVRESAKDMAIRESAIIGVSLIFSYLILYFILRRWILGPIEIIYKGMARARGGDFDVRIPLKSKNELGMLAETFNGTLQELKDSKASLEEAKSVLEVRVEARTRELRELAGSLDSQVKERTGELRAKLEELGKFNKLAVGRELKMVELKEEIKILKKKLEKQK
jgi:methyl-accepting chemotaxis protein